jgi:WD40 repeat protein
VAGIRVGFSRDPQTGRVNVHFSQGFHPDHVDLLKKQERLGTVFFSSRGQPLADNTLKLLRDVPMTGLAFFNVPVTDRGLEALRGHPQLASILLDRPRITDAGLDTLPTLPQLARVGIECADLSDAGLAKLAALPRLTSVRLFQCPHITDAGVSQLARLPALESLYLNANEKLTRRVVKPLCGLKTLTHLVLDGVALTAADAAEVARLPKLVALGLSESGLGDEAAPHLGRLKSLQSLSLRSAALGDASVAALRQLTELRFLDLSHNAVTDRGAADLVGLPHLESLGLSSTKVTDAGLAALGKLRGLKRLYLDNTAVTGRGLRALEGLPQLEVLSVRGTSVAEQEIAGLCERRPTLRVFPIPRPAPGALVRELALPPAPPPIAGLAGRTDLVGPRRADRFGDPLPPGALLRLGTVRFQHGTFGCGAALSPDGKVLVTGGGETLRVWDTATGRLLRRYEPVPTVSGALGGGSFVGISPDGKTLACARIGRAVHFWDLATGAPQPTLPTSEGPVYCLSYSPDGKRLATGGDRAPVHVLDLSTRRAVPLAEVRSRLVQFTPDGKSLLVQAADKKALAEVSADDGQEARRFEHGAEVRAVALSRDGRLLATAGADGTARVWEMATAKQRHALAHRPTGTRAECWCIAVAFQPTGNLLATATSDNLIYLWDTNTGMEVGRLRGHESTVEALLFAPQGETLYSVGMDGVVKRWDVAARQERPVVGEGVDSHHQALSPDGKTVLSGSGAPGVLHLTDIATGRRLHTLQGRGSQPPAVFSPDGALVATGGLDCLARVWDVASGREVRTLGGPDLGAWKRTAALAFSPDHRILVTISIAAGKAKFWDVATGAALREVDHPAARYVAFSPDGGTLALGSSAFRQSVITLWEPGTGVQRHTIEVPGAGILAGLTFSPDGGTLASNDFAGLIVLRDARTAGEVRQWKSDQGYVGHLAYTPSGLELLSAGKDRSLRLWDVATGQELGRWDGHQGELLGLACARDGRTAVTSSRDGTVLVWDLRPAPQPLPAGGAAALWESLSQPGAAAYRAGWALADHPAEAVALLRDRLKPAAVVVVDGPQVDRWLIDLDSSKFAVREAAAKALAGLGAAIEPRLRQAVADAASAEVRRRVQELLDKLPRGGEAPEAWRQRRALRVLEQLDTPDARQLLHQLARGAPAAPLTREAKAALERLGRRAGAAP